MRLGRLTGSTCGLGLGLGLRPVLTERPVVAEPAASWFSQTGEAIKSWWAEGTGTGAASTRGSKASLNGSGSAGARRDGPMGPGTFTGNSDAWPELMQFAGNPDNHHRMIYGTHGDQFLVTDAHSHLLILGPPRQNKTAGVLIPLVLSSGGPVVSSSTRDDVLRACAGTRSRLGRIWHFTPDGSATAPGATPLRWSPLTTNWGAARRFALAMLTTSESAHSEAGKNSGYFADQAARLVAPTLMAAALAGHSMEWATDILISQDSAFYGRVQEILDSHKSAPGAKNAANALAGVLSMPMSHGSAADIYATAARTFEVYNDPDVIAATEPANFDPAAFVAGQPDVINPGRFTDLDRKLSANPLDSIQSRLPRGVYDTIFITADGEAAEAVAPIIVGLLSALHRAAQQQTKVDQDANYYGRPPMTWALDEVANMAPWPRFPKVLATSAGSNVLVAAVFQDLSQVKQRWNEEASGLRTLMRHKVIFPGIENAETLQEISDSIGGHWVQTTSSSQGEGHNLQGGFLTGTGGRSSESSTTTSQQWLPILDTGIISRGNPNDPSAVLATAPSWVDGHIWIHPMPYYAVQPWPELLVGSLRHLYEVATDDDPRTRLPMPSLDQNNGAGLAPYRSPEAVRWILEHVKFYRDWQAALPPFVAPEERQRTANTPVDDLVDDLYGPDDLGARP